MLHMIDDRMITREALHWPQGKIYYSNSDRRLKAEGRLTMRFLLYS
jgi:hypothetical protein